MSDITITLNGTELPLSERDMRELALMQQSPGWELLKRILAGMERGTRRELESPDTPLDSIRALQGRLSVVTDLRDLVDDGVVRWVEAQSKRKDTHE